MALVTAWRLWHGLSHDICLAWETAREFITHPDHPRRSQATRPPNTAFTGEALQPGVSCFPVCTIACQGGTEFRRACSNHISISS